MSRTTLFVSLFALFGALPLAQASTINLGNGESIDLGGTTVTCGQAVSQQPTRYCECRLLQTTGNVTDPNTQCMAYDCYGLFKVTIEPDGSKSEIKLGNNYIGGQFCDSQLSSNPSCQ